MLWNPSRQTGGGVSIIDSFEDGDLSEWSEDTGSYDVVDETSVAPNAVDGTQMVMSTGTSNITISSYPGDGLDNYFPKGTVAKWYVYLETLGDQVRLQFGKESTGNTYRVELAPNSSNVKLEINNSFSVTTFASSAFNFGIDEWVTVTITRDDGTLGGADNDIVAEFENGIDGGSPTTLSHNDSTFAAFDGIGIRTQRVNNNGQFYYDYIHRP